MRVGLIQALGGMSKFTATLRQATRRSWLVGLLLLPICIFAVHLISDIVVGTYAQGWDYVTAITKPWSSVWEWFMPKYGPRLMSIKHMEYFFGLFLTINVVLAYVVTRVVWIALRPNNSIRSFPSIPSA